MEKTVEHRVASEMPKSRRADGKERAFSANKMCLLPTLYTYPHDETDNTVDYKNQNMLLWLLMRHWSHLFIKGRIRDLQARNT